MATRDDDLHSRRTLLGTLAGGAMSLAMTSGDAAADVEPKTRSTVRDHLWLFTAVAGADNDWYEQGGIRGGSRMTPAEGAFYLNVPNLIMVRSLERPPLPQLEKWRAKTTFEQYAISFRPLDRVLWSVVGSSGAGGMREIGPVLQLAGKYPNIAGLYFDDFIIDVKPREGKDIGRPALSAAQIQSVREEMKSLHRPMEAWVTLYTHELLADHRHFRGSDPPLAEVVRSFDVLTLWTWWSDELKTLEQSLLALEAIAPKSARIALGMYIWDYDGKKPVPLDLMKHQCDLALQWIQQKRIHEIIVLGNSALDIGLPGAKFVREWIAKVGSLPLE